MISKVKFIFLFGVLLQQSNAESLDCSRLQNNALSCNSRYHCRYAVILMINCFFTSHRDQSQAEHFKINANIEEAETNLITSREDLAQNLESLEIELARCTCNDQVSAMGEEIEGEAEMLSATLSDAENEALQCHCAEEFNATSEELEGQMAQVRDELCEAQECVNNEIGNIIAALDQLSCEFENMTGNIQAQLDSIMNEERECSCDSELQELQSAQSGMEANVNNTLEQLEALATQCSCSFNLTQFEDEYAQNASALNTFLDDVRALSGECSCSNQIQALRNQLSNISESFNSSLSDWYGDFLQDAQTVYDSMNSLNGTLSVCSCFAAIVSFEGAFNESLAQLRTRLNDILISAPVTCRCADEISSLRSDINTINNNLASETASILGDFESSLQKEESDLKVRDVVHVSEMNQQTWYFNIELEKTPVCLCNQNMANIRNQISGPTENITKTLEEIMNRMNASQTSSNWFTDLQDLEDSLEELQEEIARISYLSTQCSCGFEIEELETSLTNQIVANEDDTCAARKRIECLELDGRYCPKMEKCLAYRTVLVNSPNIGKSKCENDYDATMLTLTNTNCSDIISCDLRASTYRPGNDFDYAVLTPADSGELQCARMNIMDEELQYSEIIPCDQQSTTGFYVFCVISE